MSEKLKSTQALKVIDRIVYLDDIMVNCRRKGIEVEDIEFRLLRKRLR